MNVTELLTLYGTVKESEISKRYITLKRILPILKKLPTQFKIQIIGKSVQARDIYHIQVGTGKVKLLMWSQMHGNESTTTKALIDFLNYLQTKDGEQLLTKCTLSIIPILNPDGAKAYTRVNANRIDLNRDAQSLSQPESKVLRAEFDRFQPDYCFNLHDQRTIFSAGETSLPATVSFLTPAENDERSVTAIRKKSMELIVAMNKILQEFIPNQVGRYDDGFNLNCVGDTFQTLQVPTVLFEAGHYPKDYNRDETRKYIFFAIKTGVHAIVENEITGEGFQNYFDIPQNDKLFFDIIIKSLVKNEQSAELEDVAIQYVEKLSGSKVNFVPEIVKIGNLKGFHGHQEIDTNHLNLSPINKNEATLKKIENLFRKNIIFE
ncbi:M14 metallopeptidase family protein [Zhouia sp. PK063]|uniref:M14 metallopeptidase family protein n=1 Tax=Zhouia sp. PK063 TaxID=3373602 RepID=UPI00379398BA